MSPRLEPALVEEQAVQNCRYMKDEVGVRGGG